MAKIANVGIALLVYARDDGVARRVTGVETAWTGSGFGYMGNKGAVGIRFHVTDDTTPTSGGEIFTYVPVLPPCPLRLTQRTDL